MSEQDPTADYRKYPKGPNFLGIVIGACVFMVVAFVVIWFVLHRDAKHMIPHGPNPTPNSMVLPMPGAVRADALSMRC